MDYLLLLSDRIAADCQGCVEEVDLALWEWEVFARYHGNDIG